MKVLVEPTEAVFLDSIVTGLDFLRPGEFSAIMRDGFYIVIPGGLIHAPLGECYLIRWPCGIEVREFNMLDILAEEDTL